MSDETSRYLKPLVGEIFTRKYSDREYSWSVEIHTSPPVVGPQLESGVPCVSEAVAVRTAKHWMRRLGIEVYRKKDHPGSIAGRYAKAASGKAER